MRRVARAGLLGTALLLSLAGTAAAKEGVAVLDAPIPPGAEPGSDLEVGWRVFTTDGKTEWPETGSPIFIRLTSVGRLHSVERAGREDPPGSGHYVATVTVPMGGVGLVEVGLLGESCVNGECTRSDLMFTLAEEQAHPRLATPLVPAPQVKAPEPVEPDNAYPRVAAPATPTQPVADVPVALAAVAFAGLGALTIVLLRWRRALGRA